MAHKTSWMAGWLMGTIWLPGPGIAKGARVLDEAVFVVAAEVKRCRNRCAVFDPGVSAMSGCSGDLLRRLPRCRFLSVARHAPSCPSTTELKVQLGPVWVPVVLIWAGGTHANGTPGLLIRGSW